MRKKDHQRNSSAEKFVDVYSKYSPRTAFYERERLYLQWVEVGIALVSHLLKVGDLDEALKVLQKLLRREEYNERVYCLAMQYWAHLGDVARVVRCFKDLESALAELGIKPSTKAVRMLLFCKGGGLDE